MLNKRGRSRALPGITFDMALRDIRASATTKPTKPKNETPEERQARITAKVQAMLATIPRSKGGTKP